MNSNLQNQWKQTFYRLGTFNEKCVELFCKDIVNSMTRKDQMMSFAEYNMYYYFLKAVIYYMQYNLHSRDCTFDGIIKIANCVDKPIDNILMTSAIDVLFYTKNRATRDETIDIMTYYNAFQHYFYIAYKSLNMFVDKLTIEVEAYKERLTSC